MSDLQPGMLAMIIDAKHCHENIGKIVEIESFHKKGDPYENGGKFNRDLFTCSGDGLIAAFVIQNSDEIVKESGNFTFCAPQDLMPIKPEADSLHVTHKEELHA